jgi:glycerol kinase
MCLLINGARGMFMLFCLAPLTAALIAQVGWHEHDPCEIFRNVLLCMQAVSEVLATQAKIFLNKTPLAAIGVTNQRETTVAWNRETGIPYYNAIVWDDTRTSSLVHAMARGDINRLRAKTGLPLASYFAGTKVKWLLANVADLQHDLRHEESRSEVAVGTIDSWLLYQLTGSPSAYAGAINAGGIFQTDVTNASRWLFCDIATGRWDSELMAAILGEHADLLPVTSLPEIKPSSFVYATLRAEAGLEMFQGVPLASVLGDQQAALFGQAAFEAGQAKNTYGTGLFLMMHTGDKMVESKHGLLTTIAFQMEGEHIQYALEGSVSHSGSTIQWLRDQLQLIESAADTETLATSHNDGCYLVPAFAGLFAPHWRDDARGCIVGLTATHHKGHICRAALEAAAYQTREVLDAIEADSGIEISTLKVDGGGTKNRVLMQFQSDIIGKSVVRPVVMETTALGAALAAGLAVGVWKDLDEIKDMWQASETLEPQMSEEERERNIYGWNKAVQRSFGWIDDDNNSNAESDSKGMETIEDESEGKDTKEMEAETPVSREVQIVDTPRSSVEQAPPSTPAKTEVPRRFSFVDTERLKAEKVSVAIGIVTLITLVGISATVGFVLGRSSTIRRR